MLSSELKLKQDLGLILREVLEYPLELDLRLIETKSVGGDMWSLENVSYGREKEKSINFALEAFGASQLAYLLAYVLSAGEGSTICIEEPEIHLHPASQARLVKKLVEIAKERGLQLIITTHSEHILLKFLNLVVAKEVSKDDLRVYYFERDPEKPVTKVEELQVTESGELVGGLKGFFEHEVRMLEEFLKARASSR